MKLERSYLQLKFFNGLFVLIALLCSFSSFSQYVAEISVVDGEAGEEGVNPAQFQVDLVATGVPPVGPRTVNYSVSGNASNGGDYDALSGILNFPAGIVSGVIDIAGVIDDDFVEGDETVIITLTSCIGCTLNADPNKITASIDVLDNDTAIISIDPDMTSIDENGVNGLLNINLTKPKGAVFNVVVSFNTSTSTATGPGSMPPNDFSFSGDVNAVGTAVVFPVGSNAQNVTIEVAPNDDTLVEGNEILVITLTGTNNPLFTIDPLNNSATLTIIDDECPSGSAAPPLRTTTASEYCDVTSVNLNTFVVGGAASAPQGAALRWSLVPDPTESADLLPSSQATVSGTYYGVYWADDDSCSSLSLEVELVISETANSGTPVANITRCNEAGNGVSTAINLNNTITGEDTGGTWAYISGGTADPGISATDVVNFNGDPVGVYVFEYTVQSDAPCLPASTQSTITVTGCSTSCVAGTDAPVLNASTAIEYCDVPSVNLNTFVVGGANSAPDDSSLRWSLVPDPTESADLLPNSQATASGTYYGLYWADDDSCASPSLEIEFVISTTANSGTAIANLTRCNESGFGVSTSINLFNAITGEDTGGDWTYISGGTGDPGLNASGGVNFDGDPAGVYVFEYTVQSPPPCIAASTQVSITVTGCDPCTAGSEAPELANDAPETVYCSDTENNEEITIDLDDMTNSVPPAGAELRWSTLSDVSNENAHLLSSIITITTGSTYYGFFWDAVNDCASDALAIPILIKSIPTLSVGDDQTRCGSGEVTFTASAMVNGANATVNWFATPNSASLLGAGQSFSTTITETTTFYVEATLNGCTTSPRIPVIGNVVQQPSSGTPINDGGNASACSNPNNGPAIIDLDDLIVNEDPGNWVYTSGPSGENINLPSNNIINFEGKSDGDYVFTYTTVGAQAPCLNESTVITISVNDCDIDSDGDGLLDGLEAELGTNPNEIDSDGDGLNDAAEVGSDTSNPLNEDNDSFIDALDSNLADIDNDGVVDQQDPANENPCVPERLNGVCDFDGDGIPDGDEFADGSDPDDPCDPDPENGACSSEVDLAIVKEVDNLNAQRGDTVVFTITVNNLTNGTASSIIVSDVLESGFEYVSDNPSIGTYDLATGEWSIQAIAGLESASLEITVVVLQEGNYTNKAEIEAIFQTDTNLENNISETIIIDPCEIDPVTGLCNGEVDLEILKAVDNIDAQVGDTVVFTVTVNNLSDTAASSVIVGDLLENGFEYVSDSPSIGEYDEVTGEWAIEVLNGLESATLEITADVIDGGNNYSNTAELLAVFQEDTNDENNTSETIALDIATPDEIDLVLTKKAVSARPLVGDEVIFTITVTNESSADVTVNNIEVEDIIAADSGFVYISSNTSMGSTYDISTGVWIIESLARNEDATLEIRVSVPNEGSFDNTAEIVSSSPSDGNQENNSETVMVIVSEPTPAEVGFLYNQFSPNGDGTNDELRINLTNFETGEQVNVIYDIQIFNRYGALVHQADNLTGEEVWDGTWKGDNAPDGTYFYNMSMEIEGEESKFKKGWIQLIRY